MSARDSYRQRMLCKEFMILCSALGSGGLVSRRTTGRRSEDHFQPAGRAAGRFGSGQLAAAAVAAVVRMAAAFRAEAWAQHAMVLTYLLDLKAAVLTASCTRFRREADPPDLAHLVTVEKVWTRRAQWMESSSAGVPWKKKTLLLSPWLGRARLAGPIRHVH